MTLETRKRATLHLERCFWVRGHGHDETFFAGVRHGNTASHVITLLSSRTNIGEP